MGAPPSLPRSLAGGERNRGAQAARGAWIAFLDDDCYVDPGYLNAIATEIDAGRTDVLEGKIVCPDRLIYPFDMSPINETGGVYWSANLVVRRKCFLRLGGFDEEFERGEDMEFAYRFKQCGMTAQFVENILAFHPRRRLTLAGYWRHCLNDRWRLLLHIKTGQAPSVDLPLRRVLPGMAAAGNCKLFPYLVPQRGKFERAAWRRIVLGELWKWLTMPYFLPYMVFWEVRFRKRIGRRNRSNTGSRLDPVR